MKTIDVVMPLPNGPDAWSDQSIIYCNHDATFVADVIVTPDCVTVIAKGKFLLKRGTDGAQWRIVDMNGGYWNPGKGRFVIPRKSATKLF